MPLMFARGPEAGADTDALNKALARALGPDAASVPTLERAGAPLDADVAAAIRRWQSGVGIIADGIVGPRGQVLLELLPSQGDKFGAVKPSVSNVCRLFPATKPANIARYLP